MRILAVVGRQYSGNEHAVEPMYLEFTQPLRHLGHCVEHYDHALAAQQIGVERNGEQFVQAVRRGGYDAVLYQTAGRDWMCREAIREAGQYAPVIAWNSDDDWQWDSYTRLVCPFFTYMVTTYRHIYLANRTRHPNLRLSQWGCLEPIAGCVARDIDFSFVGALYGSRWRDCATLRKLAGLRVFGPGSGLINRGLPQIKGAWRFKALYGRAVDFDEVNRLWSRSRVSFTPMEASRNPEIIQIKSRVFEMGLSGTLMLCTRNSSLEEFYEPDKEYVDYGDVEECAEKAKYYLEHETQRAEIAMAYARRTRSEHMWEHRFKVLFAECNLPT